MANPWFRLYGGEFLSDSKIMSLDGNERSIWITLLCLGSQTEGVISFMNEVQIIEKAGVKNKPRYAGVLNKFEERGMITLSNGNVTIVNWAKRQYSEGYLRVKTFRETKMKRNGNGNVTPYTDTDTDTDTDTENTNTAFEKFWSSYPKKVAKQKTYSAFKRIPASEHAKIVGDLIFRVKSPQWTKDHGQYIPNPTTYLNQERWKDQVELPKNEPPPKKCKECKSTTSSSYIQTTGGYLCGDCDVGLRERLEGSRRLEEMKSGAVKSF